jgi:hypothetical protein
MYLGLKKSGSIRSGIKRQKAARITHRRIKTRFSPNQASCFAITPLGQKSASPAAPSINASVIVRGKKNGITV